MSEVVVQYGKSGFVGRFLAAAAYARGCGVVVRTVRGLELGTVLHAGHFTQAVNSLPDGEVEREAGADDVNDDRVAAQAIAYAEAADAPASWLDVEVTLDGTVILHALPWGDSDLTPCLDEIAARVGRTVKLFDVSRTPFTADPPTTCGKPDCGTGGGRCDSCGSGCSTGGCSRGAVKSADDLTAYFADLRRQMETPRTPLV